MATTLGTVGTAIAGFAVSDSEGAPARGAISQGTVHLITMLLLPVSIAMIAYAMFTFYWRSEFIRKKQVGFFDDKVGPITLAVVVEVCLLVIIAAAFKDIYFAGGPA
jgi:nitrogen fixation-related uncharacterized protein